MEVALKVIEMIISSVICATMILLASPPLFNHFGLTPLPWTGEVFASITSIAYIYIAFR